MPELGQYAGAVLGAYAVSFVLIGGLVVLTLRRAARAKQLLARAEARTKGRKNG